MYPAMVHPVNHLQVLLLLLVFSCCITNLSLQILVPRLHCFQFTFLVEKLYTHIYTHNSFYAKSGSSNHKQEQKILLTSFL